MPVVQSSFKPSPLLLLFQVMIAALQNLVKIMSLYYQYMEAYMGPALFAVSWSKGCYVGIKPPFVHPLPPPFPLPPSLSLLPPL